MAFWAFICFYVDLLGLHFLSFWPFGPSFPFILVFWAFISFHFRLLGLQLLQIGLVGFRFLSFWLFRPSFSVIFWRFFHFLSFWPFGPQFPFILAFWAFIFGHFLAFSFISFHFGLLCLHFLSFWPFRPSFSVIFWRFLSFPFILAFCAFISFHFGLLGLHFLAFWPFVLSFPFILAFWAFISFHFGILGIFILAFWAFISFHFGLLGVRSWGLPQKLPKTLRFPNVPYKFSSARPGFVTMMAFTCCAVGHGSLPLPLGAPGLGTRHWRVKPRPHRSYAYLSLLPALCLT